MSLLIFESNLCKLLTSFEKNKNKNLRSHFRPTFMQVIILKIYNPNAWFIVYLIKVYNPNASNYSNSGTRSKPSYDCVKWSGYCDKFYNEILIDLIRIYKNQICKIIMKLVLLTKYKIANEFFVGHKGPTTVDYQDSYHHCRQI